MTDASGRGTDHRLSLRTGAGHAGSIPLRQTGRQLSGDDSRVRTPARITGVWVTSANRATGCSVSLLGQSALSAIRLDDDWRRQYAH